MVFGSIVDIFYQWEVLGLFDIILPFLLIFAVVFGILDYIKIFGGKKGINVIIALVIGLLAVRFPLLSIVLSEIAPQLGVGIVIILTILILIGLFVPSGFKKVLGFILMGIGAIIFIIILSNTYSNIGGYGYGGGFVTQDLIGYVVLVALLIGVIVAVVVGGQEKSTGKQFKNTLSSLFGDAE